LRGSEGGLARYDSIRQRDRSTKAPRGVVRILEAIDFCDVVQVFVFQALEISTAGAGGLRVLEGVSGSLLQRKYEE
jgi:hypothetical protein